MTQLETNQKLPQTKNNKLDKKSSLSSSALFLDYEEDKSRYPDHVSEAEIVRSSRIVWVFFVLLAALTCWSYYANIVEVTTGTGKIVPSSREQIVQSLEGGILSELFVRAGDHVQKDQVLAQLDLTKTEADVDESIVRRVALYAKAIRLQAEVEQTALEFPEEVLARPGLAEIETRLFEARQQSFKDSIAGLEESLGLVQEELRLTQRLANQGAASNVEVLKLQRQVSELQLQITDRRSEYFITAREELNDTQAEIKSLESVIRGRADSLTRLTLRSPVRGIVKDIAVTTQGGIIPPNGELMRIIPLIDTLLIEARISPRDIAYIYPGQKAEVKITAYEYSIFGGLDGQVVFISPDTIQDEFNPEIFYYRVFVRTTTDALTDKHGNTHSIVPGMVATVDIITGEKTVFDYLTKPFSNVNQALRER